jgi:hypothetical protein
VSISAQQGRYDIVIRFSAPFEPVTLQLTDIQVSGRNIVNYRQLDDRSIAIAVDQPLAVGTLVTVAPAPHQIRLVGNLSVPTTTVQVQLDTTPIGILGALTGPADAVVLQFSELPLLTPDFTLANLSASDIEVLQGSAATVPFIESGGDCDMLTSVCWFHVRSTELAVGNTVRIAPGAFTDGAGNPSARVNAVVTADVVRPSLTSARLFDRTEFEGFESGVFVFGPYSMIAGSPVTFSVVVSGSSGTVQVQVFNGRTIVVTAPSDATWNDVADALVASPARDLAFVAVVVPTEKVKPLGPVGVRGSSVSQRIRLCFDELIDFASLNWLVVDRDGLSGTTADQYLVKFAFYEAPGFDRCVDWAASTVPGFSSFTSNSRVFLPPVRDVAGNESLDTETTLVAG